MAAAAGGEPTSSDNNTSKTDSSSDDISYDKFTELYFMAARSSSPDVRANFVRVFAERFIEPHGRHMATWAIADDFMRRMLKLAGPNGCLTCVQNR